MENNYQKALVQILLQLQFNHLETYEALKSVIIKAINDNNIVVAVNERSKSLALQITP